MPRTRKPSERTHRHRETPELNLTSFMDMITNLMFFLLLFANIIPVVMINAPLPKVAQTADEIRIAKEQDQKLDVSVKITTRGFVVISELGGSKNIPLEASGKFPYENLHKYLVGLHKRLPKAREITLIPEDQIFYEVIIRVMDASRELVGGDPGFKPVPPEITQKPESLQFNRLFPDVMIGGV